MTEINLDHLCNTLKSNLGCDCHVFDEIMNDKTLVIDADSLKDAVTLLDCEFDNLHLSAITAQQRDPQADDIEVIYHFYLGEGFSLLTSLLGEEHVLPSIVSIIPGADFYEREIAEMFGVTFSGRTETLPLLLPEDWDQGPPFIRKEDKDE